MKITHLIKLDRIAAWTLFLVIIAYGITGYGMTKGLISPNLASSLHLGWLGAIGLIAFVVHTSWAIHLFFKRKNIWNHFTKTGLLAFYILLAMFFGYMHFFYHATYQNTTATTTPPTAQNIITSTKNVTISTEKTPTTTITQTTPTQTTTVFTAATLLKYNGLNGKPAYVAVDGIVYDMSTVFRNGTHFGYQAGQDLSSAFHGQHPDNLLQRLPVVGTYSN